jgi:hypothetical protein
MKLIAAQEMGATTRVIAIIGSVLLLGLIVELVRRRKLKEEYSVVWVAAALVVLVLTVFAGLLYDLTDAIGAFAASSTLFLLGIVFAILVMLHMSVRISSLERKVTAVVQEVGIQNVEAEQEGEPRPE